MTRRSVVKALRPAVSVVARFYLNFVCSLALLAVAPFLFGWQSTVVMSESMEPGIRAGDVLAAQPLNAADIRSGLIRPGHVLLAESPLKQGTLYTHRVVSIQPDGTYITRGDNNDSADPAPLPEANIKGLERLRVPLIGLPIRAVHDRNFGPVAIFIVSIVLAGLSVMDEAARAKAADPTRTAPATRSQATKVRRRKRSAVTLTLMLTVTASTLAAVLALQGSAAAFSGFTAPPRSSWAAAASFGGGGGPNVATCGGATYTASADTTLTCAVGTVSGTTSNYTLTIKGTGPLVKWTVTADWAGVANWNSSKAFGTGVSDTGKITTPRTGYQIKGNANGSTNPANSWDHAWISSTKAAEVFTVQVTTN